MYLLTQQNLPIEGVYETIWKEYMWTICNWYKKERSPPTSSTTSWYMSLWKGPYHSLPDRTGQTKCQKLEIKFI